MTNGHALACPLSSPRPSAHGRRGRPGTGRDQIPTQRLTGTDTVSTDWVSVEVESVLVLELRLRVCEPARTLVLTFMYFSKGGTG